MGVTLRRIAVVNRGEAAMRVINAVRELRAETGAPIQTIALHTAAERRAMFVREADEAVCLDDFREPGPGVAYLEFETLRWALVAARADSAWVGWGFVAERPEFAEICAELGITFIGPKPDVMRQLGDKIGAKLLAESAGVPVAAWSGGPVDTVEAAAEHAAKIGYPLMIKATAGGGGRGIRRVDSFDQLAEAFESARSEGGKAFGDPTVFMERVVTDARHVEVQLIADEHGTAWAAGVRDCSLQRRNQKVIEESHCVVLSPAQDAELRDAAVRLALTAGYTNAGTVEFLYQPASGEFAFLEVNTRLQVEHPVTELTTGLDLVKLQLLVASGAALPGPEPPNPSGYAIEARLNAEDPQRGFTPAPGTITTLAFPVGPGIRVDTGVAEGDVIPPEYDSMIAKVIAYGATRNEAIGRLHRALEQTLAIVAGGTTNKPFLMHLLDQPDVRASTIDTGWLDRLTAVDGHIPTAFGDVALVVAAVVAAGDLHDFERQRFIGLAGRGRPTVDPAVGREIELRAGQQPVRALVRQLAPTRFSVAVGDDEVVADIVKLGRARQRVTIGARTFSASVSSTESDVLVEVDGVAHRFSRDEAGVVRAPAAALVVGVDVAPGDEVAAGERLVTVEAMKMEIAITAPAAGRVSEVHVTRNTQVDAGAPLIRVDAIIGDGDADDTGAAGGAAIDLTALATTSSASDADDIATPDRSEPLQAYLLGYDIDERAAAAVVDDAVVAGTDVAAFNVFADLVGLTPERRSPDDQVQTPREWLNSYLRTFDAVREGLPSWFVDRLDRAVRHYGVDSLELDDEAQPTDALADAMMRIVVADQRRDQRARVVNLLLEARLRFTDNDEPSAPAPELLDALDRLIEATQRRFPAIASLARGVRYRHVDQPLVERHQAEAAAGVRAELAELLADPGPERTAELVDALVARPLPVLGVFSENGVFATTDRAATLLEVLTRRYYKIRSIRPFSVATIAGSGSGPVSTDVVRTSYERHDRTVHILVARAATGAPAGALAAIADVAATLEEPDTAVVDFYLPVAATAAIDTLAASVQADIDAAHLPATVRRVAVVLAGSTGQSGVRVLTFRRVGTDGSRPYWMPTSRTDDVSGAIPRVDPDRPLSERFVEDVKFRGMHPMIARRLQMWRLANFDFSRIPSGDEVYAFDCVARGNPTDRRLVAVAEVRDITTVRDDNGRLVALPGVEDVLIACLDAIRNARNQPGLGRLEWNRVMLHVWPEVDFPFDEVRLIARRLTPLTEGLGIEQVVVSAKLRDPSTGTPTDVVLRLGYEAGRGLTVRVTEPPTEPMLPLDDFTRKLIQSRRRGLVYPYELVSILSGRNGTFVEHDLDDGDQLVPVDRQPGLNKAGVVVGTVSTPTAAHPEGLARVVICGDPTKAMGSITEAECRRILAVIDLAAERQLPVEWFALSAGAKIAMDSGSENLDWVARVLRRLVEHTQAGGEVNVVVSGINVGAQPYWNAESTMLMHTSGILVMVPDSAMVLTGKQAIDYSGGVSAEDNLGIGGYGRIMGPNGEAQYFAPNLAAACTLLLQHYELTYNAPGERWPRRVDTADPADRDVRSTPHVVEGSDFATVGDIFSPATNKDRKKPFDIRTVMGAVLDADHERLERWPEMAEAEMAVVWDARLGGHAVTMIGIESRPLPRHGITPADGPAQWSAGTLFPLSSKKVARAINAASGRRPVVVLANLSGFDGSPESLRRLQLEYGAEIGRAIVNFDGPFVLCVVSRYHGGAFVVFSATLNDDMEVLAVDGSFASVIGGAPAAAVVFTRDVDDRTRADARVRELEEAIASGGATGEDVNVRRAQLASLLDEVRTEKLGEVAAEFDSIHSVERARSVGSVHRIIDPAKLRPELIAAVERGTARIDARADAATRTGSA